MLMKRFTAFIFFSLTSLVTQAGIDQPWNEMEEGCNENAAAAIVVLAIIALIIHLVEKGEFLGFLKDVAKGLSFIATIYLVAFWFLACIVVIAVLLQAFGLSKDTSGMIAFPTGLYAAYKIFSAYQDWRNPKPNDTP